MELKNILLIKATDVATLKDLGFKSTNYYCGNWGMMPMYTKVRDLLEKLGIPFPFNKACFLHDKGYYAIKNSKNKLGMKVVNKLRVDFKFLQDMFLILETSKSKKIKAYKNHLERRMWFYFIVVTLLTPVYWIVGKFSNESKN